MARSAEKPYTKLLLTLMAEKTSILSKAQALTKMGMAETSLPLWESAAAHEERIAPLLETLGRTLEAAMHRISAASCYEMAGDFSRAANFYHAALSGPLRKRNRAEVEQMLGVCLKQLSHSKLARPSGSKAKVS